MTYDEALAYLDAHVNLEVLPPADPGVGRSLDRMTRLVDVMGDPQRAYPVLHLTGTNGKGSTARMLTALLGAQGLSVGTYTSPHLERINERLAYGGQPISDGEFAALIRAVSLVEPLVGDRPTYFEILTGSAFRWFADLGVDAAVVEVGLGGRWDATNVADGQVAVVTNVELDHAEYLGTTRRSIAEVKAGIVKPDSTLVLGETDPEIASVFVDAGAREVWQRDRDFGCEVNRLALGGRVVDIRTPGASYDELFIPVHGAHQGDNAALALAAAEAFFGAPIAPDVVIDAFAGLQLPGRLEIVGRQPLVVLDGAHNPAGAHAAADAIDEAFANRPGRILVTGMLNGRDPDEMLAALGAARARLVVACPPPSPRALPAAEVAAAAARLGVAAEVASSVLEAVAVALALAEPEELVLVSGSLYVVGAARAALARG
ncbi:MAG: folC [Acidimicrobiales bacterium]|nr:folC [Acidimicrobiales bacterium]